jgi:hydrogenase maturation factor
MNLVYGEIVDVAFENGMQLGRVRVSGATKKIALDLLTGIEPGDTVLVCDGVGIAKVEKTRSDELAGDCRIPSPLGDLNYVSGHSR